MATKAKKQQLINTLKFTPCTYKISMWGYGGEKVMGTVKRAVWDPVVALEKIYKDFPGSE